MDVRVLIAEGECCGECTLQGLAARMLSACTPQSWRTAIQHRRPKPMSLHCVRTSELMRTLQTGRPERDSTSSETARLIVLAWRVCRNEQYRGDRCQPCQLVRALLNTINFSCTAMGHIIASPWTQVRLTVHDWALSFGCTSQKNPGTQLHCGAQWLVAEPVR